MNKDKVNLRDFKNISCLCNVFSMYCKILQVFFQALLLGGNRVVGKSRLSFHLT